MHVEFQPMPVENDVVPKGITLTQYEFGIGVGFDGSINEDLLNPQNEPFWNDYRYAVSHAVVSKFPQVKGDVESVSFKTLVDGYTFYLCERWKYLYRLVRAQNDIARSGNFDVVNEMNERGTTFSIPDELDKLKIREYLIPVVAAKLLPYEYDFKKVSQTEAAAAVSIKRESIDTFGITVHDPETLKNLAINRQLEGKIMTQLEQKPDVVLLTMYFAVHANSLQRHLSNSKEIHPKK